MEIRRHQGSMLLAGLAVLGLTVGCVSGPRYEPQVFGGANYPSPAEILTGRFERNPPEFYATRLKRLRANGVPDTLAGYEAIAVTLDSLGRYDDAIFALKSQAVVMHRSDSPATSDDWSLHHADYGRFLLNRWMSQGADWRMIGEVKSARDHVALAIQIQPNASDPREEVMLDMLNWIIACRTPDSRSSFASWLGRKGAVQIDRETPGLLGLIAGNDSRLPVDVYDGLEFCFSAAANPHMAGFARLREEELRPANAFLVVPPTDSSLDTSRVPEVAENFRRFRHNADTNEARR